MATIPPQEFPVEPSQPGEPSIAPPEYSPPTPDIDFPAPATPDSTPEIQPEI